jgi:hypothetical protein
LASQWQRTTMSSAGFYTNRTQGPWPRTKEEVPADVWAGLANLINRRINDGSLAMDFPFRGCDLYDEAITGTDVEELETALVTLVPALRSEPELMPDRLNALLSAGRTPPTPVVLDVIDFLGRHVAEPNHRFQCPERPHKHLEFDDGVSRANGQRQFRNDVDEIFARNGIAFTVGDDMKVARLGPPEARPLVSDLVPNTGDATLDQKLSDARSRFLSRNPQDREDALEKLWDAFERLKSLENPNKSLSVQQLIAKAAPNSRAFQTHLDAECGELTKIGNGFYIRHFETNKQPLPAPNETTVDYLFTRLASLIAYLLRQTGRM